MSSVPFRPPYYIVDRLFGAAEWRLDGDKGVRTVDAMAPIPYMLEAFMAGDRDSGEAAPQSLGRRNQSSRMKSVRHTRKHSQRLRFR